MSSPKRDSWNCIVAYVTPESERKRIQGVLTCLKQATGASYKNEIKLRNIREKDYFNFLARLGKFNGVLFTVATDAGQNHIADVMIHREVQAAKIAEHKDPMHYENGHLAVEKLSNQVRGLSPQLYVQLVCQVRLISLIVRYGILYFAQRFPKSLGKFRWRIDQKNSIRTEYERAFETLTPALLQTISLGEPLLMLRGTDYSAFQRFNYPDGETPTYLETVYGIDIKHEGPALNIGQLIHEDLNFVDSKANQGVQVADLLATGIRRCLRMEFSDNLTAARLLGSLMVQRQANEPPVWLLGFSEAEERVGIRAEKLIHVMRRNCRPMLRRSTASV